MLGYYIEVTATHRAKVPEHFVQRQSMASATRYSTQELAELESRIASAAERALTLELELFEELCRAVLGEAEAIATTARAGPPRRRRGIAEPLRPSATAVPRSTTATPS